jgi:hypothetical protein
MQVLRPYREARGKGNKINAHMNHRHIPRHSSRIRPLRIKIVLQKCYRSVTRALQECYEASIELLQERDKNTVLQQCYKRAIIMFPSCHRSFTRMLQECNKSLTHVDHRHVLRHSACLRSLHIPESHLFVLMAVIV